MKTLSEVMESLVRRGFTEHFGVRGDQLRGFESGKTFGSQDVIIREYDRFEGASDPDDMEILYALESSGGIRGTLVDAFGVYSNPVISAYLSRVRFVGTGHAERPNHEDGSASEKPGWYDVGLATTQQMQDANFVR
jgi:hypothetical protein